MGVGFKIAFAPQEQGKILGPVKTDTRVLRYSALSLDSYPFLPSVIRMYDTTDRFALHRLHTLEGRCDPRWHLHALPGPRCLDLVPLTLGNY